MSGRDPRDLVIPTAHGDLPAYLAIPAAAAEGRPAPGVVVVHEAFGLNDDIRAHADRLAEHGFVALAPDLLAWGSMVACLRQIVREIGRGEGRVFDEVDACREWLADRDDCTGSVGVLGFCMGGGVALAVAPGRGFDAAVANYGQVPKDVGRRMSGACPLLANFGDRDFVAKGGIPRLRAALEAEGVEHRIDVYPGAGHSFLNATPSGPKGWPSKIMGFGYHEESATQAWEQILGWFDEHLAAAPR